MRIAVNTRFLLKGRLEGIGWFTHEIIKRIVLNHPEHEFIFFFDRAYDPSFLFAPNIIPVILHPPARHPVLWYIWFEWSVKNALRQYKADVFISTDGFLSLATKVPTILVVHDLAFEHFPEHLPFKFRYYLQKFTPRFVKKSLLTITVSEYSKQDLVQRYGTPAGKIAVVYNGVNALYRPLEYEEKLAIKARYARGSEYFVFTGALHPRKNILRLLDAFTLFKKRTNSGMKLLIIGRYAWKSEDIRRAVEQHPYKDDVKQYNYMQVEELCKVIGAAYALTFVSLFEGFGIPVLEALKCHVPVIVSNSSSIPEVAGDAGLYADPNDVEGIAQQMSLMYKDEHMRNTLIRRCEAQAAKFSWDKSALLFYEEMAKAFPPLLK